MQSAHSGSSPTIPTQKSFNSSDVTSMFLFPSSELQTKHSFVASSSEEQDNNRTDNIIKLNFFIIKLLNFNKLHKLYEYYSPFIEGYVVV